MTASPSGPAVTAPLYRHIANAVVAMRNCRASDNMDWFARWHERLKNIERNSLPSGSGLDNGTKIDLAESGSERIVLVTSFHHMNDHGFYTKWTEHKIIVKPCLLSGFTIRVTGRDHRDVKNYLAELFDEVLRRESTDLFLAGVAV